MLIEWLRQLGFGRAVPEGEDNRDAPTPALSPFGEDGLHPDYRQVPMHPGRLGGVIEPWAATIHYTATHPHTFEALALRAQKVRGPGSGWHFLVGRTPEEGVIQQAPLHRNANHAGGGVDPSTGKARAHGWVAVRDGDRVVKYHPNRVCVGIEFSLVGRLTKIDGRWRMTSGGKPHGAPIPDGDVAPAGPTRGWHLPTAWQIDAGLALVDALSAELLHRVPAGTIDSIPTGETPSWARVLRRTGERGRVGIPLFGHCDLDPLRKEDPGPELLDRVVVDRGW